MERPIDIEVDDAERLAIYRSTHNQEVLGQLFNKYMSLVFGLCLKYFEDKEAAKDAVMDIYELIALKLKTHEVEYFKSWLFMVSKNHCLQKLRKSNRKKVSEKEAYLMYTEQVFHPDTITDPILLKKMKDCMNKLPKEQYDCVEMFYMREMSYHQVCEQTQLTWNKVRSFIQNGRRNLKKCMSQ